MTRGDSSENFSSETNMSRILYMPRVIISKFKIFLTDMNSSLGCIRCDCSYPIRENNFGFREVLSTDGILFHQPVVDTCQCHVIKIIITVSRLYIFNLSLDSYLSGIVFFFVRIFVVEQLQLNTSVCIWYYIPYISRSNKGSHSSSSTKSFDSR